MISLNEVLNVTNKVVLLLLFIFLLDSCSFNFGTSNNNADDHNTSNNIAPMPVISRNVPAYTTSGTNTLVNDDLYSTISWVSAAEYPVWFAYDLSNTQKEQRGQVLISWYNNTYAYFENVGRSPGDYTIDVHSAEGGTLPDSDDPGWVTLESITNNIYHSRQHVVNMTNNSTVYNWIRIYITQVCGAYESVSLNIDIHDASAGFQDSWLFCGDSITAGAMYQSEVTITDSLEGPNFAQVVNELLPDHFPAQENAGRGVWTTNDALGIGNENRDINQTVITWLDHFPGKYPYPVPSELLRQSRPRTPNLEYWRGRAHLLFAI